MDDRKKRPLPCQRCAAQRRKCSLSKPSCERCFKANADCVYKDRKWGQRTLAYTSTAASLTDSDIDSASLQSGSADSASSTPMLDKIVTAFEAAHFDGEALALWQRQKFHAELLERDLFPTQEEYFLVREMFRSDSEAVASYTRFLQSEFPINFAHFCQISPPLRVILVLIALQSTTDTDDLTTPAQIACFRRAWKLVQRCMGHPTLDTVKVFFNLSYIAFSSGQIDFSLLMRKVCLQHMAAIRLDHDPDDLPELSKLSQAEKQMRRDWFWLIATRKYCTSLISLDFPRIAMTRVRDEGRSRFAVASIRELLLDVRRAYVCVPKSVPDLLAWPELVNINAQFLEILTGIPPHLILLRDPALDQETQFRFWYNQISSNSNEHYNISSITSAYFQCLTSINRATLFLLARADPASLQITSNAYSLSECINVLQRSVTAAHDAFSCFRFFLCATEGSGMTFPGIPQLFEADDWVYAIPLLEISIVHWFCVTQMRSKWRSWIPAPLTMKVLREDMEVLLAFLAMIRGTYTSEDDAGLEALLLHLGLADAMVREMDAVLAGLATEMTLVEYVEVKMRVLAISEEGDRLEVLRERDLLMYLGFLGLDVLGGWRLPSSLDETWRKFWATI